MCQSSLSEVFDSIEKLSNLGISSFSWIMNLISVDAQKYPTIKKLMTSKKLSLDKHSSFLLINIKSSNLIGEICIMFPMLRFWIHSVWFKNPKICLRSIIGFFFPSFYLILLLYPLIGLYYLLPFIITSASEESSFIEEFMF